MSPALALRMAKRHKFLIVVCLFDFNCIGFSPSPGIFFSFCLQFPNAVKTIMIALHQESGDVHSFSSLFTPDKPVCARLLRPWFPVSASVTAELTWGSC